MHLTDPKRLGITLLRATGNADHLAQLEEVARGKGKAVSVQTTVSGMPPKAVLIYRQR